VPGATELLHSNLLEVFGERDPERRWAAIGRTYTEDAVFTDADGDFVGWQALSDRAQQLLDASAPGDVFEADGPAYVGADAAALAWRFGPPGKPVVRGVDCLTIRGGRVSAVRTLIAPRPDA
jgi:SnoaL-like domain